MNTTPTISEIFRNGLWQENPGVVQLLGLCPLLAVSNTLINGLGLGIATIAVMCMTNLLVSVTRRVTHNDLRLPTFVLIIAAFVTVVELLFKAWLYDLHLALGIFLPLIVTNCVILGRAEAFASRQPVMQSVVDGFAHGLGFAWVLITLGALREVIGFGTLFRNAEFLFGPGAADWMLQFGSASTGLVLATLPPGAFIGLGLLVAARNRLHRQRPLDSDDETTDATPAIGK